MDYTASMDHEQAVHSSTAAGGRAESSGGLFRRMEGGNRAIMSSTPLGPAAVGLLVGIIAAERAEMGPGTSLVLLIAASAAMAFAFLRERVSVLAVLAAGMAVGGMVHWSRVQCIPPSSLEHILQRGGTIVRLRGQVVSEPKLPDSDDSIFRPWQFREDQTSFLFRACELETDKGWHASTGMVKVTIREAVLDLAEGDQVELFGRLLELEPPKNPGAFDWRDYFRQQGVVARMYCDQRENVVLLERNGAGFASWLRAKSRGFLTDDIAATATEESSLLEAMVLGHRSRFDRRLNDVFTRAGCVHFIAASGTNIVVLMGALWLVGRLMGLNQRQCAWIMIVAIVLYGLIAEARPPILRACVMGIMFCIAILLQRAPSHMNWICAAALVLCLFDPLTVFDVGFQLSFAAVLGVAYLAPAILIAFNRLYWWFRHVVLRDPYAQADRVLCREAERFTNSTFRGRLRRFAGKIAWALVIVIAVSLGAWLITAPITACWFQRVQPWGVLSTAIVYPLMSAVMVLGLLKAALAMISPTLAWLVTSILGLIDDVMIRLVERLADLPGASPIMPPPPWWLLVIYYLFLLSIALTYHAKRMSVPIEAGQNQASQSNSVFRRPWCVLTIFVVLAAGSIAWHCDGSLKPAVRMTALSVGAGSAVVMEFPDGATILYDAGSLSVAGAGMNVIAPFLRYRGIRRIDEIYVSHPNLDHFSGIPELIAEFPTGPIILNHCFEALSPRRSPAARFVQYLEREDHLIETTEAEEIQWDFGGARIEKLWPLVRDCSGLTANDSSTVLRVSYAGHSLLLPGDIDERAERALLNSNVKADVLLLPHHGAVRSTTARFLESVNAEILIRSSNEPIAETTNGLLSLVGAARLANTADCGAITIVFNEDGISTESWLGCDLH